MELIRISTHKLKIMLTPTDMRHFELNAATFGEDRVQMHRAFRLLLDEVRRQTDFDADDNRISVQYFPSREGGCEMFISHLSPEAIFREGDGEPPPCYHALGEGRKAPKNTYMREFVYEFQKLGHLLSACRRLQEGGYAGESAAYRGDSGAYYLFLKLLTSSPFSIPEELSFLVEYGSIGAATTQRIYLSEHGTQLCAEDAVHRLGNLA